MSIGTTIVERASSFMATTVDRRGLLRRAAMAGTAMAVAPTTFALQRTSAYAAVCGCSNQLCDCGSMCCDGYTEFCCTITGRNACPPGTLLAGWWKVDGSNFCGGAARYYLDCNSGCGSCGCGSSGVCGGSCSGTQCTCGRLDCRNRKSGCTRFRYGQCHSEIPCLGPIVCRVVSCQPPWQLDATCSTAPLVDNATRFHNASCLQGFPFGAIDGVAVVNGGYRVWGWVADPDATGPIEVHVYANGAARNLGGTNVNRPDVTAAYPGFTWRTGFDAVIPGSQVPAGGNTSICVYGINVGTGANQLLGCASVDASPIHNLEVVERVPGGLRVAGWAVDRDELSPVEIHAYVNGGGHNLGPADRPRPDVAARFGLGTDRWGFDRVIGVGPTGSLQVCVYAINKGPGTNRAVGCRTITNADAPVGGVDIVRREPTGIRVAGWAWDPDRAPAVSLQATIGGSQFALGPTNRPRPDVVARFPGAPANCGYDVLVPYDPPGGTLSVCVTAVDPRGGPGRQLGCVSLRADNDPIGNVEVIARSGSGLRVAGWALDPDIASSTPIHVYVNGGGHNLGNASLNRPDIAAAHPGYGPLHGFDTVIPDVPGGSLVVDVYAIGVDDGNPHTLLRRATVG